MLINTTALKLFRDARYFIYLFYLQPIPINAHIISFWTVYDISHFAINLWWIYSVSVFLSLSAVGLLVLTVGEGSPA